MKRAEILQLHMLTEEEQWNMLVDEVLKPRGLYKNRQKSPYHYESLADCAFRLRGEAGRIPLSSIAIVYSMVVGDFDTGYYRAQTWMANYAEPIHWIQAALLAKESQC